MLHAVVAMILVHCFEIEEIDIVEQAAERGEEMRRIWIAVVASLLLCNCIVSAAQDVQDVCKSIEELIQGVPAVCKSMETDLKKIAKQSSDSDREVVYGVLDRLGEVKRAVASVAATASASSTSKGAPDSTAIASGSASSPAMDALGVKISVPPVVASVVGAAGSSGLGPIVLSSPLDVLKSTSVASVTATVSAASNVLSTAQQAPAVVASGSSELSVTTAVPAVIDGAVSSATTTIPASTVSVLPALPVLPDVTITPSVVVEAALGASATAALPSQGSGASFVPTTLPVLPELPPLPALP